MRILIAALCVVCLSVVVTAQTQVIIGTERFAWDYPDADLASGAVTRFEVKYDDGAFTSVGIPTETADIPGGKTYKVQFSALKPGTHTVTARACNVDVCSEPMAPLGFVLAVVPSIPSNPRIIK
jgi:hypothetical protein